MWLLSSTPPLLGRRGQAKPHAALGLGMSALEKPTAWAGRRSPKGRLLLSCRTGDTRLGGQQAVDQRQESEWVQAAAAMSMRMSLLGCH